MKQQLAIDEGLGRLKCEVIAGIDIIPIISVVNFISSVLFSPKN